MKRFVFLLLGLVVIFGAIILYRLYQDSFPNPDNAVSEYISRITKNSRGEIENIAVVSTTPRDGNESELVLLFRASGKGVDIHIAGYAIVKKSLFGWYVEKLQMFSKSPLPDDMMVNLDWSDGSQVIYGQVFLANASSVEAIFSDPNKGQVTVSAKIPVGNFVLFGSQYGELVEFKILDSNGNVLKQLTKDELQNG
jgi:hypothetical protein